MVVKPSLAVSGRHPTFPARLEQVLPAPPLPGDNCTRQSKPPGKFKLGLAALVASQLFSLSAYAAQSESERIAELEKKLERSLAMIEQLSNRLSQVEGGKTAPSVQDAAAEKIATQTERIDQLEKTIVQVSENSAKRNDLGLPLHGFADVDYLHSSNDPNGRQGGFALGTLDIYLTPQFGDRVKSIIELAFEYDDTGALATDLERLQFGYTFSDAITLWAGRFHTPYGNWNTAFHHGPQIQTSVIRPRFIDFEDKGGILPAHAVGLLASGGLRVGDGKLQYDAYLANGNSITGGVLDFNAVKDDNSNKLVGGNLRYEFAGALEGLTLGVHALTQQVDDIANSNKTKMNVYGGFAVLDRANWEVIGEYYGFRNEDLSGATGTHSSWAGFAQAGYTFGGAWTPYLRLEKAVLDQTDNYFLGQASGRSYQRQALGLRYDLNALSALKVELNQTTEDNALVPQKTNEVRLQFAVRF